MKVNELIEWLQKLNQDWEIFIGGDIDCEIGGIEPHEANREYMIWTTEKGE